jgi:hypothetical protein
MYRLPALNLRRSTGGNYYESVGEVTGKLLSYLWKEKWWWATPMILTLLGLGILVFLSEPNQPSLVSRRTLVDDRSTP